MDAAPARGVPGERIPDIEVTVEPAETAMLPMDAVSTRRAVCLLVCHPNGVQVMSADIPGLVQTS